jgi:hypothetical protein
VLLVVGEYRLDVPPNSRQVLLQLILIQLRPLRAPPTAEGNNRETL